MDYLILALAVWRISNLLVNEEGPYLILNRFRDAIGIYYLDNGESESGNEFGKVFTCVWCLSIWLGFFITVFYATIPVYTTLICLPFALSTGAIIFNEVIKK